MLINCLVGCGLFDAMLLLQMLSQPFPGLTLQNFACYIEQGAYRVQAMIFVIIWSSAIIFLPLYILPYGECAVSSAQM